MDMRPPSMLVSEVVPDQPGTRPSHQLKRLWGTQPNRKRKALCTKNRPQINAEERRSGERQNRRFHLLHLRFSAFLCGKWNRSLLQWSGIEEVYLSTGEYLMARLLLFWMIVLANGLPLAADE